MTTFSDTEEFKQLNVGFVLDEGIASEDDTYLAFNGERTALWVKITCTGSPGHGSKFIANTAAEKMRSIINSALEFRVSEKKKMVENNLYLGDATSLNWTVLKGNSKQYNVIPDEIVAGFDIRIPPKVDFNDLEAMLQSWCTAAGPGVTYDVVGKHITKEITPVDQSNKFWVAFENGLKKRGCKFAVKIFSAGTDSGTLRQRGYWAIGFSPLINTPQLLHDYNEFINEDVFLRGIEIYETLIEELASV